MANIMYPPARPQSVGEILDSAFQLFRVTWLSCLPYALLGVIIGQLPAFYSLVTGRPLITLGAQPTLSGTFWALFFVTLVVDLIVYAAILLRQHRIAIGRPPATREELTTAVRRIPGVVVLSFLSTLAFVLCIVLAFVFPASQRMVGALLAVVAASCVLLALSSAYPVLVINGEGAVASMIHSARLTWGNWLRLTLIYTVALFLLLAFYLVFVSVAGVVSVIFGHADVVVLTAASTVVGIILGSIITPFYTALLLAVLGDLLVRKEGTDLAQRISASSSR